MKQRATKAAKFVIRWGIAIGGIWWVIAHMSLRDSILLLDPQTNSVRRVELAEHGEEYQPQYRIYDPQTGQVVVVDRALALNPPSADDRPRPIRVWHEGREVVARLLGMRLSGDINRPWIEKGSPDILVELPDGQRKWIYKSEVVNPEQLIDVPRPRVEVGVISLVQRANPWLLLLSVAIFPVTFLITSYRWYKLLRAIDVQMTLWRAFMINMVGAFYNSFMPGSTGGDVLKAYYASKQTPHRTRAVVSVLIDRVLGLLALVMVGAVAATIQYLLSEHKDDATARACLQVALACVGVMAAVGVLLAVMFQPTVRKYLGLEYVLNRLPMQQQVESARQVTRIYRRQPWLVLWALLITIPVHVTVVLSAMIAGFAFDLPIRWPFYFTAVPVIVLVGSVPISPQGAGVMEFFAILLTQRQGATVSQAFALTMSIRMVQILWNLTGGIFVLRGGFQAPTEAQQREMAEEQPAELEDQKVTG
ncbi:lysylphosphatidylglycerol synthase transmembrane domain-containing protein [Fontivita pretiosa]|uniref:lysylphosphatidylglycerol synthase transmembrane domain-containing protein n=1 Tax=Fontivita pretiosa TaxID=2989684 RepID=UPI003D186F98